MLISKTAIVTMNPFTKKWYDEKGYPWTKQGNLFEVKVEVLPPGSTAKVLVNCDYKKEGCKGVHNKPYRQYIEDKERGYGNCCTNKKCGAAKTKDIMLDEHGVDNIQKLDSYKVASRKRQQKPFQLIIDQAKKKDLILLTTEEEYDNKYTRIRFICGIQSTPAEVFLKNKGCCEYGKGELCAESSRLDGNIVYQAFIDKGLIPKFKSEDYEKNSIPLPYLCPEHLDKGIQYKAYANLFTNTYKCYYCSKEAMKEQLRTDEQIVFDYFEQRGLIILDGEQYKNKDTNIKYRCKLHSEYIQETSYSGLQNTKEPCDYCRAEKSLSKLNRRLRSSINKWRTQSKKNCNNKCIFTGSKTFDIHHLKSYNEIIKEALNELGYNIKDKYSGEEIINIRNKVIELHNKYPLGVCIHNLIHTLFHQLYSKESTIEDFEEFKIRYNLGEFKEILKSIS